MTRQDAEVLMLRAEVERLRGQVAHWRAARESAIAGGDILKAEVERLRACVMVADAMHETWYDGKDAALGELMAKYGAARAALGADHD